MYFDQDRVCAGAHFFVLAEFAGDGEPRVQIGLERLANDEFLNGTDGVADQVDVFFFEPRTERGNGLPWRR